MHRRTFLGTLAGGVIAARGHLSALTPAAPSIDAEALRQRIEALSAFGRPAGGTFADGVSRVAYSDADVAGRK